MQKEDILQERYRLMFISLKFLGVRLFKDKPCNSRLIFCVIVALVGTASAFYTLYITWSDLTTFLKCLCVLMQAIAGIVKLSLFVKNKGRKEKLFLFIEDIRDANLNGPPSRQEIIFKTTIQYKKMMKWLMVAFALIMVVIVSYPVYALFCLHKLELFFEIQLIGYPMENADARTYILNFTMQAFEIFYAYQGNILYDVVMFTLVFQIFLLDKLVKVAFQEMEGQIGKTPNFLNENFRNCLIMLKNVNSYILELKDIYSTVILVQIGTSSVKLALSLFCVLKTDWISGYGFAFLSFIEIMMYCILGTFLEEMNDSFARTIYEFKWYSTSREHQKMILFALMKAQNTAKFTIGGIAALNVETGGSIFKTVYTYLMVLLNFVE